MEKDFEIKISALGGQNTGYPGAFTPIVKKIIEKIIYGKVLHLFSGQSTIGEERIDIQHVNATKRMDVKEFLKSDNRLWDWILLDPPYNIQNKSKTKEYYIQRPLAADIELRNLIRNYAYLHTKNVLWLDYAAPMIKGFKRKKLYFLFPGGFRNIRVLSWLVKDELCISCKWSGKKCRVPFHPKRKGRVTKCIGYTYEEVRKRGGNEVEEQICL